MNQAKGQARPRRCPACRKADLQPATRVREFRPHGQVLRVELLTSKCPVCSALATSAEQHSENLKRLNARKAQYGGLLLGEEILSLRRRYGITQQAAAKIFGKGKIAFSRYENETSYPDDSTTLLLKLAIEKPDVIRSLADKAGVELPLWEARCEDERRAKLRVLSGVLKVDTESSRAPGVGGKRIAWSDVFGGGQHREATYTFDHSKPVVSANDDRYTMKSAGFA